MALVKSLEEKIVAIDTAERDVDKRMGEIA